MYKASSFVQVTRLGIEIAADGDASRVEVEEHFTQLASILDVCSSTLRSLRLRLLQATKFKDYETSLLGPSKLERILVSLYIGKALLHNHLGAALHLWIALELSAARGVRCSKHVQQPAGEHLQLQEATHALHKHGACARALLQHWGRCVHLLPAAPAAPDAAMAHGHLRPRAAQSLQPCLCSQSGRTCAHWAAVASGAALFRPSSYEVQDLWCTTVTVEVNGLPAEASCGREDPVHLSWVTYLCRWTTSLSRTRYPSRHP